MFRKVVWATDGSASADAALGPATRLVAESDAELIAVHCVEMTMPGKAGGRYPIHADEPDIQRRIEQQLDQLAADGARTRLRVIYANVGEAAHRIADAADEEGGEVIVAGTRGRGPLRGLMLGSVTQRLLHFASCPVLVVPAETRAGAAEAAATAAATSREAASESPGAAVPAAERPVEVI